MKRVVILLVPLGCVTIARSGFLPVCSGQFAINTQSLFPSCRLLVSTSDRACFRLPCNMHVFVSKPDG